MLCTIEVVQLQKAVLYCNELVIFVVCQMKFYMEADGWISLEYLSVLSLYFIALYLAQPPVCTDPKAIVIDVLFFKLSTSSSLLQNNY